MTQSPHSGQAAPLTTESDDSASRRSESAVADQGADHPAGGPVTSRPTNPPTAWGETSTMTSASYVGEGGIPGAPAPAGPEWTSIPAHNADSPTGAVPLIAESPVGGPSGNPNRVPRPRGPRRARLQLRHINPWTVLKFSAVMSVALFFVWLIVVGVLFGVLDGAGIIGKINNAYTTIQGGTAQPPVTAGVVFGVAAIIGVVNVVLFIALSTVGSVVYNLCADLVGGIEITLSER